MSHAIQFPKLGISFTVNETAFSVGGFQVKWYAILISIGFLLAVLYACKSAKKMNIDVNHLIDATLAGLIGGIVCARLYYVFFFPGNSYYFENPIEILKIHEGGLAIYGGIIGGLLFGGIVAKLRKMKVPAVLDVASLGYLIGQGIGRWGNFINQEAFGSATNLPWGMYSDNTELVVPGSPVHPCFLYESILCLIGFVLLHIFTRKFRRYDGQTFILYVIWYGACRFFIEGLRTDSLLVPHTTLRVSQLVAAVCVVIGVLLLIAFRRKTSLTGCGSAKVMEGVGLNLEPASENGEEFSTIFGDKPLEKADLGLGDETIVPWGEAEGDLPPESSNTETESPDTETKPSDTEPEQE